MNGLISLSRRMFSVGGSSISPRLLGVVEKTLQRDHDVVLPLRGDVREVAEELFYFQPCHPAERDVSEEGEDVFLPDRSVIAIGGAGKGCLLPLQPGRCVNGKRGGVPLGDLQVLPPGDLEQQILDGFRFPALIGIHRWHPPDFEPVPFGKRSESDPPESEPFL